jgi:hypothetical protein
VVLQAGHATFVRLPCPLGPDMARMPRSSRDLTTLAWQQRGKPPPAESVCLKKIDAIPPEPSLTGRREFGTQFAIDPSRKSENNRGTRFLIDGERANSKGLGPWPPGAASH